MLDQNEVNGNTLVVENTTFISPTAAANVLPVVELFADFPVKGKHNLHLVKEFKHPKAGVMVQRIEWLTHQRYEFDGIGGLELNIFTRGKYPNMKTLTERVGLSNRKSVYEALDEIRVSYEFEAGEHLDPDTIDFQGKYYATYYNRREHVVVWFRNVKKFNALVAKINAKVAQNNAKKDAKKERADTVYDTVPILSVIPCCNRADTVVNTIELELESEQVFISRKPKQETSEPVATDNSIPTEVYESVGKTKANPKVNSGGSGESGHSEHEGKTKSPPKYDIGNDSEAVPAICTTVYDDPFTCYKKLMATRYGYTVSFSPKLNQKLKQLQSNFNVAINDKRFLDISGDPLDLRFNLFLEDVFDNWDSITTELAGAWFWYEGTTPDANTFCTNGGQELIDWFVRYMASEREKQFAGLVGSYAFPTSATTLQ